MPTNWPASVRPDLARGLGQAEVRQVGVVVGPDEDVLRLDVAVDEPDVVRGVERVGDLGEDAQGAARVELPREDQVLQRRARG